MKITLEYSTLIKIKGYANNSVLELPSNCTVGDLLALLKLPADFHRAVIVHVNGEPAWKSTVLKEDDSVRLYLMMGAG